MAINQSGASQPLITNNSITILSDHLLPIIHFLVYWITTLSEAGMVVWDFPFMGVGHLLFPHQPGLSWSFIEEWTAWDSISNPLPYRQRYQWWLKTIISTVIKTLTLFFMPWLTETTFIITDCSVPAGGFCSFLCALYVAVPRLRDRQRWSLRTEKPASSVANWTNQLWTAVIH